MEYKLVYIEWTDAVANSEWKNKEDFEDWVDSDDWLIKTVGWIWEETPKYIVTFSTFTPESERGVEQFADLRKIPKTWIKKRRILKI